MTYREGEADAARRMPDLTAPPGAQHQAQHARNISVRPASSSFVMADDKDGVEGAENPPSSQRKPRSEAKTPKATCRTRTGDLRFTKPLPPVVSGEHTGSCKHSNASTSSSPSSCAQEPSKTDPDLAKLIDAWPTLPEPVKAGIRAMVDAARSFG